MAQTAEQESNFMSELYIGLMSGTSVDGIDIALVDFSQSHPQLIDACCTPYTTDLRERILALCQPGENEINRLGEIDVLLGKKFAAAALQLLQKNRLNPAQIRAIGSHGQTIRHHPTHGFTLQIGDPNIIAAETGITTIADFRRRDMAWGGQGAPLVPAFHQAIFAATHDRVIVNIGGIANVTVLSADHKMVLGFDTGPGNTLLDSWAEKHLRQPCDESGNWGKQGIVQQPLLHAMLADPFFQKTAPKSTGREYFNLTWLQSFSIGNYQPVDIQATLTELTVQSILRAISCYFLECEILICGGGIHNTFLLQRLRDNTRYRIDSTERYGIHPDWVEATAFAWLAKQTLAQKPGSLMAVTGARKASILGGVYFV